MDINLKKWSGSIVGIFITGILVNAIWDFIKSYTGSILVFFVKVATLGITSLNDNIYKEIAKGFHEKTSLGVFVIANLSFCYIFMLFLLSARLLIKKIEQKNVINEKNLVVKDKGLKSFYTQKIIFKFFLEPLTIIIFIVTGFDVIREKYVNNAITYYNQLLVISGPEINDAQLKVFNSNFSQIKNSNDYIKLIKEIEDIITSKKYFLPTRPSLL